MFIKNDDDDDRSKLMFRATEVEPRQSLSVTPSTAYGEA